MADQQEAGKKVEVIAYNSSVYYPTLQIFNVEGM